MPTNLGEFSLSVSQSAARGRTWLYLRWPLQATVGCRKIPDKLGCHEMTQDGCWCFSPPSFLPSLSFICTHTHMHTYTCIHTNMYVHTLTHMHMRKCCLDSGCRSGRTLTVSRMKWSKDSGCCRWRGTERAPECQCCQPPAEWLWGRSLTSWSFCFLNCREL